MYQGRPVTSAALFLVVAPAVMIYSENGMWRSSEPFQGDTANSWLSDGRCGYSCCLCLNCALFKHRQRHLIMHHAAKATMSYGVILLCLLPQGTCQHNEARRASHAKRTKTPPRVLCLSLLNIQAHPLPSSCGTTAEAQQRHLAAHWLVSSQRFVQCCEELLHGLF